MTQDKNQQEIKLYVDDRGNMSVGIHPMDYSKRSKKILCK
jgi:hypothetical protein